MVWIPEIAVAFSLVYLAPSQTREDRFIAKCKAQFPAHQWQKSQPILQEIRGVKEAEEIAQMQTACNITGKGIRRLLGFIKPGVWEYEIEAELLHEFVRNRSKGFAYTPIIACKMGWLFCHWWAGNCALHLAIKRSSLVWVSTA